MNKLAPVLIVLLLLATAGPALSAGGDHSLSFDGTDDVVWVPDPVNPTAGLTIEAWVHLDGTDLNGRIATNRVASLGYDLSIYDPGGGVELRYGHNGGLVLNVPMGDPVGEWVHVASTWGGPGTGRARLYIDGVQVAEMDWADDLLDSTDNLRIGVLFSQSTYFKGLIDEVRIWDAELDGTTIATWKNWTLSSDHPNWSDLMGYWRFEEGAGQTVASEVNSPAYDGELGSGSGTDSQDPAWEANGAPLPVEKTSFGRIKNAYR